MANLFLLKYDTAFGEDIRISLGGRALAMEWTEGNLWRIETEVPSGTHTYIYSLWRGDVCLREEAAPHTFTGKPFSWDWWHEHPEAGRKPLESVFGPFGTRAAGIAVPVFSLRTARSFGTGEFADLKPLSDFAAATGMRCIQLLPVNDTTRTFTWMDSYPYNACSSFALHPMYLNLEDAGIVPDEEYAALKEELDSLPQIDYERVNRTKDSLLRRHFAEVGEEETESSGYLDFLSANKAWAVPYACFRALSKEKGTADFSLWGDMAEYSSAKIRRWCASNSEEVRYHLWVQYKLHLQLADAAAYARGLGVHLKGDLPIGVSRESADAWEHPELFNMDFSAGAPPDFFSRDGQNWGFPTYNWEAMAKDGYAWWKARLGKMSEYFDAFRIDHILGFFRIWEIPYSINGVAGVKVSGAFGHFNPQLPYSVQEIEYFDSIPGQHPLFLEDSRRKGFYSPRIDAFDLPEYRLMSAERKKAFDILYLDFFHYRHNGFWKRLAEDKLGAVVSSTSMLACGEDLGMIAACVPEVMEEYHILSLEMPRMPKKPGVEFGDSSDYPYLSVCTTSTHDMSPMRLWWNTNPEAASRYFNDILHLEGEVPADPSDGICSAIVSRVLRSPSMLCIVPLQDWLACSGKLRLDTSESPVDEDGVPASLKAEQINDPANSRHYWRYRMHIRIENMLTDTKFREHIRKMLKDSYRIQSFIV